MNASPRLERDRGPHPPHVCNSRPPLTEQPDTADVGVLVLGLENVIIRGGSIERFRYGVKLESDSANVTLRHLVFHWNSGSRE